MLDGVLGIYSISVVYYFTYIYWNEWFRGPWVQRVVSNWCFNLACSLAKGGMAVAASEGVKEKAEEKEATDEDPREHLNIVFIGHGERHWIDSLTCLFVAMLRERVELCLIATYTKFDITQFRKGKPVIYRIVQNLQELLNDFQFDGMPPVLCLSRLGIYWKPLVMPVDAGKSTLSGNILYLTDFVDKRTIERQVIYIGSYWQYQYGKVNQMLCQANGWRWVFYFDCASNRSHGKTEMVYPNRLLSLPPYLRWCIQILEAVICNEEWSLERSWYCDMSGMKGKPNSAIESHGF